MQFQKTLTTVEAMEEFRTLSNLFRAGNYYPQNYYESCKTVLSDNFDEIFPELLALLPDISKQQVRLFCSLKFKIDTNAFFLKELYTLYAQDTRHESTKKQKKQNKLKNLTVCEMCKQVLLVGDLTSHYQSHSLEIHFPNLKNKEATIKSVWKQ